MNDDDLGARLSGALHELGDRPSPPSALDPAKLRRRADARRARRQAAGASLASAMVFVIGIGTVYYAAHKSRPRVIAGADTQPYVATPAITYPPLPHAAPYTSRVTILTAPPTVQAVAGVSAGIGYELIGDGSALVTRVEYGDGAEDVHCPSQAAGEAAVPASSAPLGEARHGSATHTWATPGTYSYRMVAGHSCSDAESVTVTGTVVVGSVPTPAPTGVTTTDVQPPSDPLLPVRPAAPTAGLPTPQPRVPGATFQPAAP